MITSVPFNRAQKAARKALNKSKQKTLHINNSSGSKIHQSFKKAQVAGIAGAAGLAHANSIDQSE